MSDPIIAYVDDLVDAIRGLAEALIGRASHQPHDTDRDDDDS